MAESPSSQAQPEQNDAGAAGGKTDGVAPTLEIAVGPDGLPVVDLRAAPAKDGALAVIDGELVLRLPDGAEWPVDNFFGDAAVLQLGDRAFIEANAAKEAIGTSGAVLPLADLAASLVAEADPRQPAAAEDAAAAGEAAEEAGEPVSGGAAFRTFEIADLGALLQPTLALAATNLERFPDDGVAPAGTPANGSRFFNLDPVAAADRAVTGERQAVEIDVLANDRDPNQDDALRIVAVDATGIEGEVTLTPEGTLVYDPAGRFTHLGLGETAIETVTYTVADKHGGTAKATLRIVVEGANDTPTAAADSASTSEKAAVVVEVLANDSDPDASDLLTVQAVDAQGLEGRVTVLPNGQIAYDPNGRFTHLGQGEEATETFRYTAADPHGATSSTTVTVKITGVNDAPIGVDDLVTVRETDEVRFDALANDRDPDANDTLRVVSLHSLGDSAGQRWINHDGTLTYRPFGDYDHLDEGEIAYQTFGYTVADQHGATSTATVTVKIIGVNDAPVAADDHVVVSEKGEVRFAALANDFDPNTGDAIRVAGLFSQGDSLGQRWVNHDDTLTYRPFGAYDYLGEGEQAVQQFGYTVVDQYGATDTAVVSVTVLGVNDAPVAAADRATTDEDTAVVVDVLANDVDVDASDSIEVVGVDATGLAGQLTHLGDGRFSYDPAGAFDHLAVGDTATETFHYMIADQHGATAIATAEILIHGVNDAPTAVADQFVGYETIGFYAPIAALLANDFDIDQGDTFQLAGIGNAVNGEVALTPDGEVVFTPTPGHIGPAAFQYAIEDQHGAYAIGEVQVDVRPITPADMSYQTLSWFSGISQSEVSSLPDGTMLIDQLIEVGAIAAVGLEIGGMPFFSSTLTGLLQGVVSVAVLPDGTPLVAGDLGGNLDLQVETSPIFAPLGGDVYDALFLASGSADLTPLGGGIGSGSGGGAPELDDLGFGEALADLVAQAVELFDLSGGETLAEGFGLGDASAAAFGNGQFYLDIAGLISGTIDVPGGADGAALVDADIFGQFAGAAFLDIRDDLTVVSDGFLDGDFVAAVATDVASVVTEEPALAA